MGDAIRAATLPLCFEEEGGWDKDNVSSSVLLLVFVQHLLLLIRVLLFLNKKGNRRR